MEEMIALLERAERSLADAGEALNRVNIAQAVEVLQRCNALVARKQEFEAGLKSKKVALLAGLIKTYQTIRAATVRRGGNPEVHVPGLGTVTLMGTSWARPPHYNPHDDWEWVYGRFATDSSTSQFLLPLCRVLLAEIEEFVRQPKTDEFEKQAELLAEVAQQTSSLSLVLNN